MSQIACGRSCFFICACISVFSFGFKGNLRYIFYIYITPILTLAMSDMTLFSVRALFDPDGKVTNGGNSPGIRSQVSSTVLCCYIKCISRR